MVYGVNGVFCTKFRFIFVSINFMKKIDLPLFLNHNTETKYI